VPETAVIVWDLETVPDLPAAARMLDLSNAPDVEIRNALGSGFPKHPLHKIVCVGAPSQSLNQQAGSSGEKPGPLVAGFFSTERLESCDEHANIASDGCHHLRNIVR
jgi:hypothetical protein